MQFPKWLSYVALAATILTQLTAEFGKIKPAYGMITAFVAGALMLFTKSAIDNVFKLGAGWSVAGALIVVGALFTYSGGPEWTAVIGEGTLRILSSLGAILTTIGQGLRIGPPDDPSDPGDGGPPV